MLALAAACAAPALACDCVQLIRSGPHYESDVKAIVSYYPVAGDGHIIRRGDRYVFMPAREYRGLGRSEYVIGGYSTCGMTDNEVAALVGKSQLVILARSEENGKEVFELGRCVNGLDAHVTADLRRRFRATIRRR